MFALGVRTSHQHLHEVCLTAIKADVGVAAAHEAKMPICICGGTSETFVETGKANLSLSLSRSLSLSLSLALSLSLSLFLSFFLIYTTSCISCLMKLLVKRPCLDPKSSVVGGWMADGLPKPAAACSSGGANWHDRSIFLCSCQCSRVCNQHSLL